MRVNSSFPFDFLSIDHGSSTPLQRQVYRSLREAILDGRLRSGMRLPSTRYMARQIGVSRNVVMDAFQRLTAEGFLKGHVGSGTYVAAGQSRPQWGRTQVRSPRISRWAGAWAEKETVTGPLSPGLPDGDAFPTTRWTQLVSRYWRERSGVSGADDLTLGLESLRSAIGDCIALMRGIVCSVGEVVITSTIEHALQSVARVVADPGDAILVEDPSDPAVRAGFAALGLRAAPCPIDLEGVRLPSSIAGHTLLHTQCARQRPLGVAMSVRRRLQLLDWAQRAGSIVIEEDRDLGAAESAASLRSLDRNGQVIYCGSFEKTLAPGLALAFAIVPAAIAPMVGRVVQLTGGGASLADQFALAHFIANGEYARHLRRIRALYAEREAALEEALMQVLGGVVTSVSQGAALESIAWLSAGFSDSAIAAHEVVRQAGVRPLSSFAVESALPAALVMGYGRVPAGEMRGAIERLTTAFRRDESFRPPSSSDTPVMAMNTP